LKNYLAHFIKYQLPAIVWALFIFFASSVPSGKLPKFFHYVNDKLIHTVVFLVFGLLVYRALQPIGSRNKFNWSRICISVAVVVLYGITDEFHQHFVPGRTVDIMDAFADTLGGILSAFVVYFASIRKPLV
jgi:VanZ family protein